MDIFKRSFFIFLICLAMLSKQISNAQSLDDYSSIRSELNSMFEDLDKSKIITGLLLDYAVDLVDLSLFDGENMSDSSTVNYATLQYILSSIRSAAPVTAPFQDVSVISDTLSARNLRTGHIPICLTVFDYNQIRADALTNNLINYDESTGKVSDKYIGNSWVNPYTVNTVVAFSPLINTSTSWNVTFTYDDEYLFSNRIINNITIDFGDGLGYRPLSEGTYSISYPEPGEFEIRIKVYLWHNPDPLEAHSFIAIGLYPSHNMAPPVSPPQPDSTFVVSATGSYSNGIPQATVSIKYATGHNKHLVKPFIVAEGIDPIRFNPNYVAGNYYRNKGVTNLRTFTSSDYPTSDIDYDIVYIDWEDSCAPLELNVDILKQVIQFVNHEKTDSTQSLVLMGQSMGGLMSRIALCQMEDDHEPHNVSVFLSQDAPHLGANVPVGLLYLAQFLYKKICRLSSITRSILLSKVFPSLTYAERDIIYQDLIRLRDAPSVKQMLYNYVDTTLTLVDNNSDYHQWQANNYSKYPKGDGIIPFKSLSLSNGGNTVPSFSNDIASFNASFTASLILHWFAAPFHLFDNPIEAYLDLIPRHTTLDYAIRVKPYFNNDEQVFYYRNRLRKKFLWIPFSDKTVAEISLNSPLYGARMDRIKSSVYRLESDSVSVEYLSYSIGHSIPFVGSVYVDYKIRNEFPFVPTASSLGYNRQPGYDLSESNYNVNFVGNTNQIQNTPFNSYFLKEDSSYHTRIDELGYADVCVWFDTMKDLEIVGPAIGETGSRYKLSDTTITVSSWSTSPNSVASIDNQGILTVAEAPGKNYSPIITGKGLFNGNPFCLHKQISVNKTISDTCHYYLTVQSGPHFLGGDAEFTVTAHKLEEVPVIGIGEEPVIDTPGWYGPDGGGLVPIPDTLITPPWLPVDPIVPVSLYTWKLLRGSDSLVVWTLPSDSLHISVTAPENNNFIISFSGTDPDGYIIPTVSVPLHDTGSLHGAIIVGPSGTLQIDDGEGNTSFILVRGQTEDISLTVEVGDIVLSYNHVPSQSDILEDLVKETSFVERLKQIEPWGDSPFLIIPYSITDNIIGTTTNLSLKFIFNSRINGDQ